MTLELLDDYLIDAEIMVERSGYARFTKEDLAELLGVATQSIWPMLARGAIPAPAYYEKLPAFGQERAIWTCAQAAEILARRAQRQTAPCGTDAAFRRHRRRGEPIDKECRDAHNAWQRKIRAQRKERAEQQAVRV